MCAANPIHGAARNDGGVEPADLLVCECFVNKPVWIPAVRERHRRRAGRSRSGSRLYEPRSRTDGRSSSGCSALIEATLGVRCTLGRDLPIHYRSTSFRRVREQVKPPAILDQDLAGGLHSGCVTKNTNHLSSYRRARRKFLRASWRADEHNSNDTHLHGGRLTPCNRTAPSGSVAHGTPCQPRRSKR